MCFDDQATIKGLQENFPSYPNNFTISTDHSSAIVQLLTWTGLKSIRFGASLQHYNPLIDNAVKKSGKLMKIGDW